jgi:hypothetical protein
MFTCFSLTVMTSLNTIQMTDSSSGGVVSDPSYVQNAALDSESDEGRNWEGSISPLDIQGGQMSEWTILIGTFVIDYALSYIICRDQQIRQLGMVFLLSC